MIKNMAAILAISFLATSVTALADVTVSNNDSRSLLFSEKLTGDYIDKNAWRKLYYISENKKTEISLQDRYYLENSDNGISKKSPSGNYTLFYSVSGENLSLEDGTEKYVDRAYCSVIDMRDGCIVSDWDGEACGYDWVNGKDILASSEEKEADVFDFTAMRPLINKESAQQVIASEVSMKNILRCEPPNKNNIEAYQLLLKHNKEYSSNINESILDYLWSLPEKGVKNKSMLFDKPHENSKTKAYLIAEDKVKIIQKSSDGRWVNIGYINRKKVPLISWIEASNLK